MIGINLGQILRQKPTAKAQIKGSVNYPGINATVRFYQMRSGVWVWIKAEGLPTRSDACSQPIFAVHIHSGTSCTGNSDDYFANAGMHYNPYGCMHPYHAGDLPPLFASLEGDAVTAFFSDRFYVRDIIGKTVIIHSSLDDFSTQPSGNAGTKIACGVIQMYK